MGKVASKELAIAIGDYYEANGLLYTVKALNPRSFAVTKTIATVQDFAAGTSEEPSEISPKTLKDAIGQLSAKPVTATVHNFGLNTPTALIGADHHMAEIHVEGGEDFTLSASDWSDGQWFRITHTAGDSTTERLRASGFAGAYLRDGKSRDISSGLFIGRQDCQFTVTITENGGMKFLNVDDESPDAFAIWDYPPEIPPSNPPRRYHPTTWIGSLVNLNGAEMRKATAIGPNALAATHYIDAWSDMLTPIYGDGCVFTLPVSVASATVGSDLYLGANGVFSSTPPPIAAGNILQPVAVVLRDGKGRINLRTAAIVP